MEVAVFDVIEVTEVYMWPALTKGSLSRKPYFGLQLKTSDLALDLNFEIFAFS